MGVLASAQELLTALFSLGVLDTFWLEYQHGGIKSSESSVKYFLLGSFATAYFLYGIALIYGATGSQRI